MKILRRTAWHLARAALLLLLLAIISLVGVNLALNTWIPTVLNRQPEQLRIDYELAWTLSPARVEMRGLRLRAQGPLDQWMVSADRAAGTLDLATLIHGSFRATDVTADGAGFLYRRRLDRPVNLGPLARPEPTVPAPGPMKLDEPTPSLAPPIPGLSNPPDPAPEDLYTMIAHPWRIQLEDVSVTHVRELWVEDYRFAGDAVVTGALDLQPRESLAATDITLNIQDGRVMLGDASVLDNLHGDVRLDIAQVNPATASPAELLGHVSGQVKLGAAVQDLRFLGFYLKSVDWLSLSSGTGDLAVAVTLDHGAFTTGSSVRAAASELSARFRGYTILGDGVVALLVEEDDSTPRSRLSLDYTDFSIVRDGDGAPHVRGEGLQISVTSPDTRLDQPFTSASITFDLPESEIPDASVYNAYLPPAAGIVLQSGTGRVGGRLVVSTADNTVAGDLTLSGTALRASIDAVSVTTDIAVEVHVPQGALDTGRYDITGSEVRFANLRVSQTGVSRSAASTSRAWWARVGIVTGQVALDSPVLLDARLNVRMRDPVPIVTIFSRKKPLPEWIRSLLPLQEVSGQAHIRLGLTTMDVPDFRMGNQTFDVQLRLRKVKSAYLGDLYLRYGRLALGVELTEGASTLRPFNPKAWFDARRSPAP